MCGLCCFCRGRGIAKRKKMRDAEIRLGSGRGARVRRAACIKWGVTVSDFGWGGAEEGGFTAEV